MASPSGPLDHHLVDDARGIDRHVDDCRRVDLAVRRAGAAILAADREPAIGGDGDIVGVKAVAMSYLV